MARKQHQRRARAKRRSAAQCEWTAAVAKASLHWRELTQQELLTWNVQASLRRMSGQRYQVQCNAGRIRDGLAPLRLPPRPAFYDPNGALKRVLIINQRGRVTLRVELRGVPTARITVWASRPLDRWVSRCYKCPRLGPLPAGDGPVRDFTALYVKRHGRLTVGKWFRLLLRQESGNGRAIGCGVADVTVPEAERPGGKAEKG
jgi:hypothetical protein